MHRRDRGIGAVAFGFGGEAVDKYRPEQCSTARHKGESPRTSRCGRRHLTALADWRWHLVTRQNAQEEVGTGDQCFVEDNGAESCHRANDHSERGPLLEIRGRRHPTGRSGREGPDPLSIPECVATEGSPRGPTQCSSPARVLHRRTWPVAPMRWRPSVASWAGSTPRDQRSPGVGGLTQCRRGVVPLRSTRCGPGADRCGQFDVVPIPSSPDARTGEMRWVQ